MGTRKQPKMPPDDQMVEDQDAIRALAKMVTPLRRRYPNNPDLMMIERCAGEFRPSMEFEPRPGQQPPTRKPRPPRTPPQPTLADRTVEK
jgi:hypothetical protein